MLYDDVPNEHQALSFIEPQVGTSILVGSAANFVNLDSSDFVFVGNTTWIAGGSKGVQLVSSPGIGTAFQQYLFCLLISWLVTCVVLVVKSTFVFYYLMHDRNDVVNSVSTGANSSVWVRSPPSLCSLLPLLSSSPSLTTFVL